MGLRDLQRSALRRRAHARTRREVNDGRPIDATTSRQQYVPQCVPLPGRSFQLLVLLQSIFSAVWVFFIALALRNISGSSNTKPRSRLSLREIAARPLPICAHPVNARLDREHLHRVMATCARVFQTARTKTGTTPDPWAWLQFSGGLGPWPCCARSAPSSA